MNWWMCSNCDYVFEVDSPPETCPKCDTKLVGLYCRNGAGGKRWVVVKSKYCKVCKKVI